MERNHFKQRIVGGLVLVAVGAIVVPFLLDMHPGAEWWGTGNIPKKPSNGFVTRVLPLDEWSKQAQTDMAKGSKQMSTVAPPSAAASVAQQPQRSDTTPASATQPSTVPLAPRSSGAETRPMAADPSSAAADTEGWVVQLGSFSNKKNAGELSDKLRNMSYRVFVDKIAQDGQTVYRVRIGPQRQRADAEAIRDKLARELQLNAIVLHLP